MLSRCLFRQSRRHSTQVFNPVIRNNVFSRNQLQNDIPKLTSDSSRSPPSSLQKSQILALKPHELSNLLSVPFQTTQESDNFCFNLIQVIHDIILKEPARALAYIESIPDPTLQDSVVQYLQKHYENDTLRRSVVLFMTDPGSEEFAKDFLHTVNQILFKSPEPRNTSVQVLLSYMKKLALSGVHNPFTIYLDESHSKELLQSPSLNHSDLYACLVQLNVKFKKTQHFEQIKSKLLRGSAIEKMVARTGILGLKWQDTEFYEYSDIQKEKMVSYFCIQDLAYFCKSAMLGKDVFLANLYLDLVVTKFEILGDIKHLRLVLDMMLVHSMTFKGPQECLKFLRYIIESKLQMTPASMLKILAMLRKSACYDEALLMINHLHSEKLSSHQREILVSEIMQVITKKFHEHPQVTIGYFASLFDEGSDFGLKLLKDLALLDIVYGADAVHSLSVVDRADIHEDLKGSKLTHAILKNVYDSILTNMPNSQKSNPVVIQKLFRQYNGQIKSAIASGNHKSIFHPRNVDESILSLFMNHLLRVDPYATDNFDLVQDNFRFVTAKEIFQEFQKHAELSRGARKPYILDLLIGSALLKHHDLPFAVELFKYGRDQSIPVSFNQIYPFVMYHIVQKENEKALRWYNLLVESGAVSKSVAATQLFKIAKELRWPVKGTSYLSSVRRKNKASRQALDTLSSDSMEEFLNTKSESVKYTSNEFKFYDELASTLNEITKKRGDSTPM